MNNRSYNIQADLAHFRMENYWFRYSDFVPRLYNWCLDMGFKPGKIMPSRSFCVDESQGYPIILLTKHFGSFPFNHGHVGGIMACDRHAAHAHHGKDLVIVHASHVGYDPESYEFGTFRYSQTKHSKCSNSCGKISNTIEWYLNEYNFASDHILVDMRADTCHITIDNQYLLPNRERGLVLNLNKIVEHQIKDEFIPVSVKSTACTFVASEQFRKRMNWFFKVNQGAQPIGDALLPEYFSFKTDLGEKVDTSRQLERNILNAMPGIVTSVEPMLTAAQVNTQAEFDRAYRSISQDPAYQNRNLLYISGLHVDISPPKGQNFILTKFIPWAAYIQLKNGDRFILEQDQLYQKIKDSNEVNPDQLDFDEVIQSMEDASPISLHLPY